MITGSKVGNAVSYRRPWFALLLMLLAVLAPTACVLWLMNQAAARQKEIEREKLREAYHSELLLLQQTLDNFWSKRSGALQEHSFNASPAQFFARKVTAGLADSVIYLDADGRLLYPTRAAGLSRDALESRSDWREARALEDEGRNLDASKAYEQIARMQKNDSVVARAFQAEIRCLLRSGEQETAVRIIEREFTGERFRRATDPAGRSIAADEQLFLLNLISRQDRFYRTAEYRLHTVAADYESWTIPAVQRLFLMEQMKKLDEGGADFPTYAAESLAQSFLDIDHGRSGGPVLELTPLPDIWKFTSDNGRVIALYHTTTVAAVMQSVLNQAYLPGGSQIIVVPPGSQTPQFDERAPAGSRLPGWQIGIRVPPSTQPEALTRGWTASYLWIGLLVIAVVAILATAAGQALQQQIRLANLKADLVAAVSHELKTPLSSMRLLVDSLLEDGDLEPGKTREYLELIARENLRLSRLIDNFLTFSRMDNKREKFMLTETQPGEVMQAAFKIARERFQSSECSIKVEISAGLPSVYADENALVTALLNLLDNAYKFTPSEKHIQLSAYSESGHVCFVVADNGVGIPLREQKKIFRRFYQVNRQLSREVGGCGLGLSIVDLIVKAHHGKVRVASSPGVGTTFILSVPSRIAAESNL